MVNKNSALMSYEAKIYSKKNQQAEAKEEIAGKIAKAKEFV